MMPRMNVDSPSVPIVRRVSLFGRLGWRRKCVRLDGYRTWALSGYASLGGPVDGHLINLVDSGLKANFFK